jgi:hypothetical protein
MAGDVIPIEEVRNLWAPVRRSLERLADPEGGDQVYGFVAGLYPTDAPTLPDPEGDPATETHEEESAEQ